MSAADRTERLERHRHRVAEAVEAFRLAHPQIPIGNALRVELRDSDRPEALLERYLRDLRRLTIKNCVSAASPPHRVAANPAVRRVPSGDTGRFYPQSH
jgi:hypothetical protein